MKLPKFVLIAIKLLEEANYEVYVVGGAVRDYLLGNDPHDFDLSSNATPDEVKKVFSNYFVIETGIKHGTVSVMILNRILEITTYRYEDEYDDFRRPNNVRFIKNIKEDLARRDFTINAICYNKKFLDLNNGINDLKNRIIKAIGDPVKRFYEDPLRILRALRFASVLDFKIEENTNKALLENFELIENVSKERINNEFSKLLMGKNVVNILSDYKTYIEKYVIGFIINDVNIQAIKYLDLDLELRIACLCLNLSIENVREKLNILKFSKKQIKTVLSILENYELDLNISNVDLMKIFKKVDYNIIGNVLKIKYANFVVQGKCVDQIEKLEYTYKELKSKYLRINDLKVNGNDLINIGFNEGIEIKIVLEKLLDECINGLENNYDILINKAKEYLGKSK